VPDAHFLSILQLPRIMRYLGARASCACLECDCVHFWCMYLTQSFGSPVSFSRVPTVVQMPSIFLAHGQTHCTGASANSETGRPERNGSGSEVVLKRRQFSRSSAADCAFRKRSSTIKQDKGNVLVSISSFSAVGSSSFPFFDEIPQSEED